MKNSGMKKLRVFCVGAVLALMCAMAGAPGAAGQSLGQGPKRLVTQAVDEHQLATLKGSMHPLARPEFDRGIVSDATPLTHITLLLKRSSEQQSALDGLMLEQQDRTSPNFHKWLTPEDFGKQFGPSDEDIKAVTDWLASQGFREVKVGVGRRTVEFSGTVGQVRKALHTEIHQLQVNGESHTANMSEPQIPAALTPVVAGVVSLHNFRKQSYFHRVGTFRRMKDTGEVKPLFTFGTPANFVVGPGDFAKIYNIPAGLDGTNQTIAIVGRTNINPKDVTDFRTMFGLPLPPFAPAVQLIPNGPDPGIVSQGEEGEADLDVEWSGAVAPMAAIKFVVSESTQSSRVDGVDLSAAYIIDNNVAPVMSESFGSCERSSLVTAEQFQSALWEQAAAQGITVMVSSGDNGATCPLSPNETAAADGVRVSLTAATPFNVAVGGTDFDQTPSTATQFWNTTNTTPAQASAKGYIPETTWNDSCAEGGSVNGCSTPRSSGADIVAGSGGPSALFTKTQAPWQTGFGDGARDIPDVSLFASNGHNLSAYVICQQDSNSGTGSSTASCDLNSPFADFQLVGGTSASSPAFAGIMALINQNEVLHGRSGQQGNANFVLYQLAKKAGASCTSAVSPPAGCIFNDTVKGNISVACHAGTANCSNTGSSGFGILTTTTGGSTPAFNAVAGYDLATGLGSVNVTSLVNNWSTASFTPSTVLLKLNGSANGPINIVHGTPVTVGVTITPPSASGGVSLMGSGNFPTLADDFRTVTAGSASWTTQLLHGGMYPVFAKYSGDGTIAAGTSINLISVIVTPETSKTSISLVPFNANGNPLPPVTSTAYGSAYILRIDVTNNSGTPCSTSSVPIACPTGQITLSDGAGPALSEFGGTNKTVLNNVGFAEDQPIQLNAGTYPLVASYLGDSSFNSSASPTTAITITQAATTTAVAASSLSITSGMSVTLTANVGSNSNADKAHAPSGTVQFSSNGTSLGAAVTCTQVASTSSAGASCTAKLTTALSAFPPGTFDTRPWRTPFEFFAALLALCALAFFVTALRMRGKRRVYGYAGVALFLIAAATLAGCGGGSSGGGGSNSHSDTVTAKYSGDTNYGASSSTGAPISVH